MDPNMQEMISSYLEIKNLVDDEETATSSDEEEKKVRFVEVQLKRKRQSLDDGGSGRRRAGSGAAGQPPLCVVEECGAGLEGFKKYYQRHRVCVVHSKSPVVLVDGLRQRFCQQCSRFHELSEFDSTKRSCRRRLVGHNMRRRKSPLEAQKASPARMLEKSQY
ncbi:Squamosa promoter-binding-like protein 3 [Striga hermonthica]|uniref:Squamosa promoter-binding-like protein 3 n=1 Tax=Striga hermonthica TaxID=68872 RepID=A0A9N7MYF0_STRHE|nr:Squamosa promoter-binding-like protein 3 [Striga hermonthica]